MRKLVKYTTFTLLGLVAGFFLLVAYVYVTTVNMFDRRYPVVASPMVAASSVEAIARGKALADRLGCTECHKADLRGGMFEDDGLLHGKYYASNLTLKAMKYSDEDIARIVRAGVRPDGRSVIAMPSSGFVGLTDPEMADIIAFVRSQPPGGVEQPEHYVGPLDRWDFYNGARGFKPMVVYVDTERRKAPADAGPHHAAARHLVDIACRECHSGDLKGGGGEGDAPDLVVATAYGLPEFTRLLRTGIGVDGKEHGLMSVVARDRFHHFSDEEIAGIHSYLTARAALPR